MPDASFPQLEFSENRAKNNRYQIVLENGKTYSGKPYQVNPSDAFFVMWLDEGSFACFDFEKLSSYTLLPSSKAQKQGEGLKIPIKKT